MEEQKQITVQDVQGAITTIDRIIADAKLTKEQRIVGEGSLSLLAQVINSLTQKKEQEAKSRKISAPPMPDKPSVETKKKAKGK